MLAMTWRGCVRAANLICLPQRTQRTSLPGSTARTTALVVLTGGLRWPPRTSAPSVAVQRSSRPHATADPGLVRAPKWSYEPQVRSSRDRAHHGRRGRGGEGRQGLAGSITAMPDKSTGEVLAGAYGANAWLVEEMYESYLADPGSVSESWREFFADYRGRAAREEAEGAVPLAALAQLQVTPPVAPPPPPTATTSPAPEAAAEIAVPLRGAAARVVENMSASLAVPTATSVRPVAAKLLEVNRAAINDQLGRTTGGKVSFTHLIAWAVVRALGAVPAMNSSFVLGETGTPGVIRHEHVGL